MYQPILDTEINTSFISEATHAFPPFSTIINLTNQSQTYRVIPSEGPDIGWFVPPHIGGSFGAGNVYEYAESRGQPAFDVATPGFLAAPALTCGLAGGLPCVPLLDSSAKSIKQHLHMHGHQYLPRQVVRCPWMGCPNTLQWMNIPRHIQSTHLGVRFMCSCGKSYTRREALTTHIASCTSAIQGEDE